VGQGKSKERSLAELLGDLQRRTVSQTPMWLPALKGFAHRFTIFFPLLSGETHREVFSDRDAVSVGDLLNDIFGGCSIETVTGKPPLTGLWKKKRKRIVDGHLRILVYTAPTSDADDFFLQLKSLLEQASGEKIILIEKAAVTILG
jgi:hypothetical protein